MTPASNMDLQLRIGEWRRAAAEGTLTLDQMKEAIVVLRAGRTAAAEASTTVKRKAAKVAVPAADDLLDELFGGAE